MELRHFRLVSKVAECGTLSKASKELFLSQSALSHQLKELETELGTVIFHRINKKLVLSVSGEIFLSYSEKILESIEELGRKLDDIKGEKLGKITISLEAYTSYFWLPPILKIFHTKHPNIEVVIKTNGITKPIQLLQDRKLDYAIVISKITNSNLEYIPLFEDELVVVSSNRHKMVNKDFFDVPDFNDENILTHASKTEHKKVLEYTRGDLVIRPQKYTHISQTQTIIEMIEENLGIAILSKWAIKPYINRNKITLTKLGVHGTYRKWYLAKLKNLLNQGHEDDFLKIIKTHIN